MVPKTFDSGGEQLPWENYEPASPDGRVVVIAYGSDGLAPLWEPEIRRHAQGLADAGILALIPDYFEKSPPVPHGNSDVVFEHILRRHGEWAQVLKDAVTVAKALPSFDGLRVGLLGFSLGGFLALRIRTSVDVLGEFFAPYQFPSAGIPPTAALLKGLGPGANPALKAQIHHGDADNLVPPGQNADQIETQLRSEGASVCRTTYLGANHGFLGGDQLNESARDESQKGSLAFFKTHL